VQTLWGGSTLSNIIPLFKHHLHKQYYRGAATSLAKRMLSSTPQQQHQSEAAGDRGAAFWRPAARPWAHAGSFQDGSFALDVSWGRPKPA
jgi:hypothetical protein